MRPLSLKVVAEPDELFLDLVEKDPRFDVAVEPCPDEERLAEFIADAEIVVSRSSTPLTRHVIESSPRLRIIAQATTGTDNIDLEAAGEKGVTVVTTPGVNSWAVAEAVVGAMITLQRGLPRYTAEMRDGTWSRGGCAGRSELRSCTVGIIGVGRVGSLVAKLLSFLDRRPLGYDPYVDDEELKTRGVEPVETLRELLQRSSIVTLHVPLTRETRGMIGHRELEQIARPRIIINTSRGAILDPEAVRGALLDGTIDGAWLDVFPDEPVSLEGWPSGNIHLSPHTAGCSLEARSGASEQLYQKICEALGFSSPE